MVTLWQNRDTKEVAKLVADIISDLCPNDHAMQKSIVDKAENICAKMNPKFIRWKFRKEVYMGLRGNAWRSCCCDEHTKNGLELCSDCQWHGES